MPDSWLGALGETVSNAWKGKKNKEPQPQLSHPTSTPKASKNKKDKNKKSVQPTPQISSPDTKTFDHVCGYGYSKGGAYGLEDTEEAMEVDIPTKIKPAYSDLYSNDITVCTDSAPFNRPEQSYSEIEFNNQEKIHMENSLKSLEEINKEFHELNKQVVLFNGSINDLVFIALQEQLTMILFKLDDIETRNNSTIRQSKELFITTVKGSLDALKQKAEKVSEDMTSADDTSSECSDFKPSCPSKEDLYGYNEAGNNVRMQNQNLEEENNIMVQPQHIDDDIDNYQIIKDDVVKYDQNDTELASENAKLLEKSKKINNANNDSFPEVSTINEIKNSNTELENNGNVKKEESKLYPGKELNILSSELQSEDLETAKMQMKNQTTLENIDVLKQNSDKSQSLEDVELKSCGQNLKNTATMNADLTTVDGEKSENVNNTSGKTIKPDVAAREVNPTNTLGNSVNSPQQQNESEYKEQIPVQLLKFNDRGSYELNEDALRRIFCRSDMKGRKIAIVSIVGAYRRGKSFLLNFMLRYLKAKGDKGWLSSCSEVSVEGFSWRGGQQRDTTGILMWPEPFFINDELAVILMDTQGTFDNKTTMKDNTFIFAFSTLISSVQIFNLAERIQMDDLHNLQYFLEFGRLTQSQCDSKAFQKLIFLIRDWKYADDNQYGFSGGEEVLGSWLSMDSSSAAHEQAEMIRTCFREIQCFLMPHPGERVSSDPNFKGNLTEIRQEFLQYLGKFVESVLCPSTLIPKMVGRDVITASDLVTHMRNWVEHLQRPDMQPKTLFESMAEMSHEKALMESIHVYMREMNAQLPGTSDVTKLQQLYEHSFTLAFKTFDSTGKFGDMVLSNKYRNKLSEKIAEKYEGMREQFIEQKQRERDEKVKELLKEGFSCFKSELDSYILATTYDVTLEQTFCAARNKAINIVQAKLNILLNTQQISVELNKLNEKMKSYYISQQPLHTKLKHREDQKMQKEEITTACDSALSLYRNMMDSQCGGMKTVPNVDSVHAKAWQQVIQQMNDKVINKYEKKIYGNSLTTLSNRIKDLHNRYRIENSEKLRRDRGEELRWSLRNAHTECVRRFRTDLEHFCQKAQDTAHMHKFTNKARFNALRLFEHCIEKFGVEDCKPYYIEAKNEISYLVNLYTKINDEKITRNNEKMVLEARVEAIRNYREHMTSLGLHKVVPDLGKHHEAAMKKILEPLNNLLERGVDCAGQIEVVQQEIQTIYKELDKSNNNMIEKEQLNVLSNALVDARKEAVEIYKKSMKEGCKKMRPGDSFDEVHAKAFKAALGEYERTAFQLPTTDNNVITSRRVLTKELNCCKEEFQDYQSERERTQNVECKLAVQDCLAYYVRNMEKHSGSTYVPELGTTHISRKNEALNNLREKIKTVGGNLVIQQYESLLNDDIETSWINFKTNNTKRRDELENENSRELTSIRLELYNSYRDKMIKNINVAQDAEDYSKLHRSTRELIMETLNQKLQKFEVKLQEHNIELLKQKIEEAFEDFELMFAKQVRNQRTQNSGQNGGKFAVGIDLGTTYSCVAVYRNSKVEVLTNKINKRTTPSVVYIGATENDVGEKAICEGFCDPSNCISEVKRIIGRKFDDKVVSDVIKLWNFKVINENGYPVIEVTKGKKKKYKPEDISGLVLREMKEQAERHLGCQVHDAVVTIPAYFNELQREATKAACVQAGLNVLRMINEPTAAAIAYGIQCKSTRSRKILVYDFGGGTCDVSILNVEGGRFSVKASRGDNKLGGEDFDDNMMKHLAEIFEEKHKLKIDITAKRRLRHQCERVKRNLTDLKQYDLEIVNFVGKTALNITVSRDMFEKINSDLFPRALVPVVDCLKEANLNVDDIDEIVMVGGSSRIPKIQELLKSHFNGKLLNNSINPDEAIAYGAAIQAAISIDQYKEKIYIQDITPFSLGTDIINDKMSIIIPKNTPIPCSRKKIYFTTKDNQTSMTVEVYQGEDTENKFGNSLLGEFVLKNLMSDKARKVGADITFAIDADGILNVTAKEEGSDNIKTVKIEKSVI